MDLSPNLFCVYFLEYSVLLSELAVRTEYVHNLVDVHLLHVLTSWLQILTWIEVSRMLSKMLAEQPRAYHRTC